MRLESQRRRLLPQFVSRIKNNKQEPSFHRLYCDSAVLGSDISSRGVMKIAPRNSRLQNLLAFSARSELRLFVFQALYNYILLQLDKQSWKSRKYRLLLQSPALMPPITR